MLLLVLATSRQRKQQKCEHVFEQKKMLRMSSITLHVLCRTISKIWTALLIGPAENCPISFLMRLLNHTLFWASAEVFQIASYVTLQSCYLNRIQLWRLISCMPLFSSSICGQNRTRVCEQCLHENVEALFTDTCNARECRR